MDGILPLWKPKGLTSHDCVIKIRKLFKTKKVGHTGTLDPEVEGVLPICIGQATKIVPYLTETTKTYIAEISIGKATETEDAQGNVIEQQEIGEQLAKSDIEQVLQNFVGNIDQTPPMYSAVKVNGKKLYEYAREGKTIERPQRTVVIHHLTLLSDVERKSETDYRFMFEVNCSKGTYIRTLCVDIGKALGFPAHMSNLVRTQTGSFHKANTYTFAQVEQATELDKHNQLLSPISQGLEHLDTWQVDANLKEKVLHGQKLHVPKQPLKTDPFKVEYNGHLLAIYQNHPNKSELIKPVKVFQME
ncbi:tRNA pseudouridine(55) synthase TruB [Aquibacillus sediminis]|uniref:tRNA pseudouridine(55) synthase TruB n=1 Tax=Aquibacillus sediminis TaxID=2574734 RepID=UPI001AEF176D|nr:tRNA pseudouridine(55) synthase TruB [Aquibacillus sediminis]